MFCEPGGAPDLLWQEIDSEITEMRADVAKARRGEATHQQASMQSLVHPSCQSSLWSSAATRGAQQQPQLQYKQNGAQQWDHKSMQKTYSVPGWGDSSTQGWDKSGSAQDPHGYPEGTFKGWGDSSFRHGVALAEGGVVFGKTLVKEVNGKPTEFASDSCLAGIAPNESAINRGRWCVKLDCKHHDTPVGSARENYSITEIGDDVDRHPWNYIKLPAGEKIYGKYPPNPPQGHPAHRNGSDAGGGKGKGKGKGEKGQGKGKGKGGDKGGGKGAKRQVAWSDGGDKASQSPNSYTTTRYP